MMKQGIKKFDKAFLINLDSRIDRLENCQAMFAENDITELIERFSAIRPENGDGRLGCILSHLSIVKKAKENGWKSVLIIEDDCLFLNQEAIDKSIEQLFNRDWSIYYLGYNSHKPLSKEDSHLLKITNCFSTHAIAYHESFYDSFINSFEKGEIKTLDVWLMYKVQPLFKCYGCYPIAATQREGYSDIERSNVNYDFIVSRFHNNTKHLK